MARTTAKQATPVRRRSRSRSAAQEPANTLGKATNRVDFSYIDINDIVPYEFNPRDNEAAVQSVANSIRSFGFKVPVVIDSNNVLIAGHTRIEASKLLGLVEVPAIRADDLTSEEVDAFRLIDNKVAEAAKWDFDLLAGEITKLQGSGLVLTDFGWTQAEIDCLSDVVSDDCLSAAAFSEDSGTARSVEKRAPSQARVVIGEFVFFLSSSAYKRWASQVRAENDFDEKSIERDLKNKLGMLEYEESEQA